MRPYAAIFALPVFVAGTAAFVVEPQARGADGPSSERPPNVVLFLIDDLGYTDVGCYGSDFYETPNIDRLAREGMRFTDAYAACCVCSPTRVSVLTGKNPARLHITHAIPIQGHLRLKGPLPLIPAIYRKNLPLEEVTIAEALKPAGYRSASVGKWHVCWEKEFYPEHQGFDVNVAGNNMGNPGTYFHPYRGRWRMTPRHPWTEWQTIAVGRPGEYLTDRLTDEAIRFIEQSADDPFLLYFPHYAVHTPLQAKEELIEKYRRKPKGKHHTNPAYAAMIDSVDQSVGRVLARLDELGLADNTVVIFTSDNGGHGRITSHHPLRGCKGNYYEGGIRVPLIVRWPGVVEPGSACCTQVVTHDFYPTLLEMAGLPLMPEQHVDGVSLVPLLRQTGDLKPRSLFWHFPNYIGATHVEPARPLSVIRDGDWKLIEFLEDGRLELYNLRDDLGEKNDLTARMPEKAKELEQKLAAWREAAKVQMPQPNPEYTDKVDEFSAVRRCVNTTALRHMIVDLQSSCPERFPRAGEFLERLAEYERNLVEADALLAGTPSVGELDRIPRTLDAAMAFQREIAFANPFLSAQPILYVVREQYLSDHHNTATLFHTGEPNCSKYRPGGALKILDPSTGRISVLIDPGPEGLVRDPEVHFDGRKMIFSMRTARDENYSIYELEVDPENGFAAVPGSLRRLTADRDATDIDPLYLPDGRIIFTSTREPKYCHCNMHIMANLYRMNGDGANIHQIGKSTLFEGHGSLLPDGRVLYYRWEYVDRNFGDAQGLWTVNPDGTSHAVFWGNNTVSPAAVFDGRAIPGTDKVVCIFGSCHDRPWGSPAIIDRSKGIDSKEGVERIWPESARNLISIDGDDLPQPFMCDHFLRVKSRYEDPYPLVDLKTANGGTYFLVSRSTSALTADKPVRRSSDLDELVMGVYLVDTFGNEILLHTEKPGCFDPMPLAPNPRPQVIPERRDYQSETGTMVVTDVYQGAAMQEVKRGEVAALRVVESREKRFWTEPLWRCAQFKTKRASGNTLNRPAISWAGFEVKQILGTVPVEADGSAHFEVPANRFVYFQLLDRDGMLISTMRSGTTVQPGEARSCVGCHEDRLDAPPASKTTMAFQRPPSKLNGWYGPARPFNYVKEVQPIWDKHCVTCHDFGKEAGEELALAGDKELVFNASYVELFQNWGEDAALLNTVGLGLAPTNPAYGVGSHRSRLVELLKGGHEEVELSAEEMDRIITWIDIGGPYYPDYGCAHPANVAGRAPLTIPEVRRLGELTGVQSLDGGNPGYGSHKLWISFDRPELSPCLQSLEQESEVYREALSDYPRRTGRASEET